MHTSGWTLNEPDDYRHCLSNTDIAAPPACLPRNISFR